MQEEATKGTNLCHPVFQGSFSCVQESLWQKESKQHAKKDPQFSYNLSASLQKHIRNKANCYADCTSVKFHVFVEKRGIFLVLFMLS